MFGFVFFFIFIKICLWPLSRAYLIPLDYDRNPARVVIVCFNRIHRNRSATGASRYHVGLRILRTRKFLRFTAYTGQHGEARQPNKNSTKWSTPSRLENYKIITIKCLLSKGCDIKHVWKDFVVMISVNGRGGDDVKCNIGCELKIIVSNEKNSDFVLQ